MKWVAYARKAKHETKLMESMTNVTNVANIEVHRLGQCCDKIVAKLLETSRSCYGTPLCHR